MLEQAAGFALLAAVSPTALLVMAIFLGSANPRRTAFMYVAGAVVMTVIMAVAVLFILRGFGLNEPRQRDPRYGLRFALGLIALLGCGFLVWRARRAQTAEKTADAPAKRPNFIMRMTADPSPWTAFVVGLLLFAPSATFIAAVQVVATANAAVKVTVLAVLVVVVITALSVWAPLLAYLAAPDATTRTLRSANDWLRTHSRRLVLGALAIGGVALSVNGALGLWH